MAQDRDERALFTSLLGGRPNLRAYSRLNLVRNRAAVQRSLERVLVWDFDRFISIHGAPGNMLEAGAKEHVAEILAWAKTSP